MLTNLIFKIPVKNLLQKILPQPGFEPGTSQLSGTGLTISCLTEACGDIYRNNMYIIMYIIIISYVKIQAGIRRIIF